MTEWLTLSDEQRRTTLEQAQIRSGIVPKAIEKDWWVTLVLKALFELHQAIHFVFKGGTSLSKGWGLLSRLSEDIDIALSPEAFKMSYENTPSHSYVKRVKKQGCVFTSSEIKNALEERLNSYELNGNQIQVEAKAINPSFPDRDPQEIIIHYRSLYPQDAYLDDKVKIEFGTRSIKEPYETVEISSLLSQNFGRLPYKEKAFRVPAASPHKTFIEKMCLMHEKIIIKEIQRPDVERQSRHLYDMVMMAEKGILERVLGNKDLYETIIEHRKNWIRMKHINYDLLRPESISFVPTTDLLEFFKEDYAKMQDIMIYGNRPTFETIIDKIKNINEQIRKI